MADGINASLGNEPPPAYYPPITNYTNSPVSGQHFPTYALATEGQFQLPPGSATSNSAAAAAAGWINPSPPFHQQQHSSVNSAGYEKFPKLKPTSSVDYNNYGGVASPYLHAPLISPDGRTNPPQGSYQNLPSFYQSEPHQNYQHQQGQNVVIMVDAPQPPAVSCLPIQSFGGHIRLACFTLWCCGFVFGFVAFILAVVADCSAVSSPPAARCCGRASVGVSVAGIIISLITVSVVLGLFLSGGYGFSKAASHQQFVSQPTSTWSTSSASCGGYAVNGKCYLYESFGYSNQWECYINFIFEESYYDGTYCYHNIQQ